MLEAVLREYGLDENTEAKTYGSGLINKTWKLKSETHEYILQRINQNVFEKPEDIAYNIKLVGDTLKSNHPDYNFVAPLRSLSGSEMIYDDQAGYFRLYPFVPNSYTIDVVENAGQAYEAATQFGRFTKLLTHTDVSRLKVTIPFFHDLPLRYRLFLKAIENGNKKRIDEAQVPIRIVKDYRDLVTHYENIKTNPAFKLRVTHHDTKISNVLFDKGGKGLCVIDLDTIMPGYFISDVGDMMRTYLSPVSEEENDFDKIEVRDEVYKAIVQGYYEEMRDELTELEKDHFLYAAKFMIYMQAVRFLTDYINDDVYYGAKYNGHNLVRAQNQLVLLQRLLDKEHVLTAVKL